MKIVFPLDSTCDFSDVDHFAETAELMSTFLDTIGYNLTDAYYDQIDGDLLTYGLFIEYELKEDN